MKIMVVSGGSSGIGLACVNKFLDDNYFVYNLDITENSSITHANYKQLNVDVRKKAEISNSISEIIKHHSKIDVLIVSAGKHLSANIESTRDEDLMELIQLNILGAFWLIQATIPHMKENNAGNIITISSDQSIIAKTNSSAYGMTKSALASLTKSIALDYVTHNIRANCICAGTIDTPLYRNAIEKYSKISGISLSEIEKAEAREQPIGRIGKSEEVAELAYFLASNKASFITGALVPIDGGYTTK